MTTDQWALERLASARTDETRVLEEGARVDHETDMEYSRPDYRHVGHRLTGTADHVSGRAVQAHLLAAGVPWWRVIVAEYRRYYLLSGYTRRSL